VAERLEGASYTERLIAALSHPEPETPLRAATILGMRRDRAAVPHLIRKAENTPDIYLAMACLEALARIGGPAAREGVRARCGDPRVLVSRRAQELLGGFGNDEAQDSDEAG
jgi:HEAT repeat protein